MIGDSYLDPAYSNTALDLFAEAQGAGALPANVTYRHYYQGGASIAGGALQFNIPYQFTNEALTDLLVPNPADIDTVIMDGGGNDILLGNTSCETSAPPGNSSCLTTMQNVVAAATTLGKTMGSKGVKHVVMFFYPHLDTAGGGLLPTPAPAINESLDYGYPLAESLCCGTSFESTATSYTCRGNALGPDCVFVDTRPAFERHTADYINPTDHVHPSPAGAKVIADLVWKAMVGACIAQ
jgi:lysophospholipase L1-like esterase